MSDAIMCCHSFKHLPRREQLLPALGPARSAPHCSSRYHMAYTPADTHRLLTACVPPHQHTAHAPLLLLSTPLCTPLPSPSPTPSLHTLCLSAPCPLNSQDPLVCGRRRQPPARPDPSTNLWLHRRGSRPRCVSARHHQRGPGFGAAGRAGLLHF